jgi:putative transposase
MGGRKVGWVTEGHPLNLVDVERVFRSSATGVPAGVIETAKDQELSLNSNLKPIADFKTTRRNLPHWEFPGSAYFVTFNTSPESSLTSEEKDITFNTIKFHQDKKYILYACVTMDTHVHLIILPLGTSGGQYYGLGQIMHSIKSYSANQIQRTTGKRGNIWFDEHYDRVIRDDNEFYEKMSYIINNPVKAGLVKDPESYRWLYYHGID